MQWGPSLVPHEAIFGAEPNLGAIEGLGVQKFSGERVLGYVFLPPYVFHPPHITAQFMARPWPTAAHASIFGDEFRKVNFLPVNFFWGHL